MRIKPNKATLGSLKAGQRIKFAHRSNKLIYVVGAPSEKYDDWTKIYPEGSNPLTCWIGFPNQSEFILT